MNRGVRRTVQILLPIAVLVAAAWGARTMMALKPEAPTRPPEVTIPQVRVVEVELDSVEFTVRSQGTVQPRTESQLVPEVSGRIVDVSSSFVAGGFFETGDILFRIESHDYEKALVQREAEIESARLRIIQEEAEAEVAQWGWDRIGDGQARSLTLREPQIASAKAALAAAEANLETARRNLERTEVRAPYVGRVREKSVDVGQFVMVGSPVARIYAVDAAEIRLPLPDEELAYLDLPVNYRGDSGQVRGPAVTLSARFAGRMHEWNGRIVRTEGEIDPRTRMVHVVAEVRDPYGRGLDPTRPPLAAGMFVEAVIAGRTVESVAVIPRAALRGTNQVIVVDDDSRLRFREIDILRATTDEVFVRTGLTTGDRVNVSPLEAVTDGMQVRTDTLRGREPAPAAGDAEEPTS
ncbi:MAG: efflux RND transporter periplasmic adaptor subunit [Vicinamibacterales bacterium]|jgi:RND family efflux transporter MFP subunit|nr:efflux transporter periplasmic adaptor subunit [Acidobacteriota bacterium]MDP7471067.1 efflux RND transporter periplasmic adaptor subunit [Vicinamibacterales bacterium]MDP7671749.1 efflux RND transporter periplasmic adaptor subunit [Vicinamibacterales bacterium]HJO39814.1 efflux RND transporter periplasmic adaptor subunit [Vicinamibacterales bacterium]|tara:strand:- start:365 stop:1591 length:1227 start_codon:yes stop_codon:yes gene_type:complete